MTGDLGRRLLPIAALVLFLVPAAGSSGAVAAGEQHCVIDVVEQLLDGELILSEPRCYSTFAEAMDDASAGKLDLATSTSGRVLWSAPEVGDLASTFTLGIHFDGYWGAGSSISVVGSSCTGGWWNTTSAWDNRISSSWNGCYRLKHHDLPNKGGTTGSTTGAGSTHNLPSFINNRAESVSYWST